MAEQSQTVVRGLMRTDVPTVGPDTSVTSIARLMTDRRCSEVVVTDTAGGVVGVITAADLVAKHAQPHLPTYFSLLGYSFALDADQTERELQRALAAKASDLMSRSVVTTTPDTAIDAAATVMLDRHVSCLPVVEDGRLVGILDENDIVRLLVVEERDDQPS